MSTHLFKNLDFASYMVNLRKNARSVTMELFCRISKNNVKKVTVYLS